MISLWANMDQELGENLRSTHLYSNQWRAIELLTKPQLSWGHNAYGAIYAALEAVDA